MRNRLNLPDTADIQKILQLDSTQLPSFPQVAAKLLSVSQQGNPSLQDISKIVETDPGISVRVLEIVNSAAYGLKREISSLSDAVIILGLDEIRKLAISMTVFEKIFKNGQAHEFDRLLFWRHSLCVAALSVEIARETGYQNLEEAYIAGLLHDIGKIFLDLKARKNYGEFIRNLSLSSDLVIEKERSYIGLGHDDVGAFFADHWKLPENLILAIKYHHQPFERVGLDKDKMNLISIVSLADFLCWTQGMGSFDFIRPPILPPEVENTLPFDRIDMIRCMEAMKDEIENISRFYQFAFPSAKELRKNILWANLKLSKANTRYYYNNHSELEAFSQETETTLPFDVSMDLGKPLSKAKTVKEVLDIVMYQVGCIFQPLHWSILLKRPKTEEMFFSVVVGSNREKLQGAKLPKGEGIAGHIMETGESLIVEDVTKDKRFSARVDQYSGFKTKSIIGTPLKTEDKTFGVIELINRISETPFSKKDLKILASIGEYAAIAIERAYYNQALTNLATRDSLTGLKNRWSFERAVSNKEEVLKTYGTIFSMLIVEALPFKENNETYPKEIAEILDQTRRREDTLFRFGEDTYIILLPQTYSDGAEKARHRLMKAFSVRSVENDIEYPEITITAYTISSADAGRLASIVRKRLSRFKTLPSSRENVSHLQENLQPMVEKEHREPADTLQEKAAQGKTVSLGGKFTRLKTGESGHIMIEILSLSFIGFRIARSHRIQENDFLDLQFTLDDIKRSLIKRRAVVREMKGNYIRADFYNPPPYAKQLGFYLMS